MTETQPHLFLYLHMKLLLRTIYLLSVSLLINGCDSVKEDTFTLLEPDASGIDFVNRVKITDSLNILTSEFVYNGGGVATADLNGDGLDDLFFTGNMVDNRLYLNQGDLRFEDITTEAGVEKPDTGMWSSGVNILDINQDGLNDIYICNTFRRDSILRENLLYINQGNGPDDIPTFLEMGEAYGANDRSHSSHAQFFDYDNDGDLDLFIGVNVIEAQYPTNFTDLSLDGTSPNRDNLFRNDWDDALGHPVFVDVSMKAGILQDGYSHSTLVHDFNDDGWLDLYVANDYLSNDLIFINNQDGTFSNQAGEIFKHFSLSSMGSDVADINNDGREDFFTSEMQPYYNKRKKLFQGPSNYLTTINTIRYNYEFQYTRNTLQLNQGVNPETSLPLYAEVGLYAGVMETDWSWTVLFADYDNDGWKDLFVANGFPKDVTDRDFSDFRATASSLVSHEVLYAAIPEVKSPNFMFRNNGDLTFTNVSEEWGMHIPSFSYGAAVSDLDHDGDLDLVVNNTDDPAFLFENSLQAQKNHHYLRVKLKGSPGNPTALGAKVKLYYNGQEQIQRSLTARGYLSQSEDIIHFGLGSAQVVDSLVVIWPGGKRSISKDIQVDQVLTMTEAEAQPYSVEQVENKEGYFQKANGITGIHHQDRDRDFIDFNFQRTLPHKFSQYGPSAAVGDVNDDTWEDVVIGGSRLENAVLWMGSANGKFTRRELDLKSDSKEEEDAGSLLFDADGDGDLDLYVVRGSGQYPAGDPLYQDVLAINDGRGHFTVDPDALPEMLANGSCVRAGDFDGDGDLDLFVGSRVLPHSFPMPDRSYILRNESSAGKVRFVDATAEVCTDLLTPGMISDASWTDYDGDSDLDLMLAGEWMPVSIYRNDGGVFSAATPGSGLEDYKGWWNSLKSVDLDNDGDLDYLAGNFGENLYFKCTSGEPIRVYGKDLDDNGSIDPLISCYWQDSLGERHEFLYHPRQDLIKQFVAIRKKYNTYSAFGEATVPEMFDQGEMENALVLQTNWMKSSALENLGNGTFKVHSLPPQAQFAPVYGIEVHDVNHDGYLDAILVGNDHGMEVQQGRADAFNGLVLLNQGNFEFESMGFEESHFLVSGDARALVKVRQGNEAFLLATQNRDSVRVYSFTEAEGEVRPVSPEAAFARIYLKNGQVRMKEFNWGSSFMSQSSRYLHYNPWTERIELFDRNGNVIPSNPN